MERKMRTFETGATRDTEEGKIDYEGFLSPEVIARFGEYMHRHRVQSDGTVRASDNWQKGIPLDVYMKSMWRHFMAVWGQHRLWWGGIVRGKLNQDITEEALCALLFNVQGYLHEILKKEGIHHEP